MMTLQDLLEWAARHNWPQLVLCRETNEVLPAGEWSWWHLVATGSQEECERAMARVREWEMRVRVGKERAA